MSTPQTAAASAPRTVQLPLAEVRRETTSVRSFRFHLGEVEFPYRPGQYVTLAVDDGQGQRLERAFSLSSSPTEQGFVAVTTRRTPSEFKRRLAARTGYKVEVVGPQGDFLLDPERPAVMIAGGIGVTPFRSMLRQAADLNSRQPVRLLYATDDPGDVAFRGDLDLICREMHDCRVFYTASQPAEGGRWCGRVGRIDLDLVDRASAGLVDPLYYVSGPPAMVRDIRACLITGTSVDPADIRCESFTGYN